MPKDKPKAVCLVRLRDLYLVIGPYPFEPDDDHWDYFIHSHQCPQNLLRNVICVHEPAYGDDPHGIIRFVAAVPAEEFDHDKAYSIKELLAVFKTDGWDAPTEWPERDHGVIPWLAELQRQYQKDKADKE